MRVWKIAELGLRKLFFLDAQPMPDLVRSGTFDLSGLLAALELRRLSVSRGAQRWQVWSSVPSMLLKSAALCAGR